MIWADKITLALFALLALALLPGSGTPPAAYAEITPAQHWGAYVSILWFLGTRYFMPFWLFLRAFDLLADGPARRRSAR